MNNEGRPIPKSPEAGTDKCVLWLSTLQTKALFVWLGILGALWAAAVQWLLPAIATLTLREKLLLQLLGAGWLLAAVLGLGWLICYLKLKAVLKKPVYLEVFGAKWTKDAQALCWKCENPLSQAGAWVILCPFCKVNMQLLDAGYPISMPTAVEKVKQRMSQS